VNGTWAKLRRSFVSPPLSNPIFAACALACVACLMSATAVADPSLNLPTSPHQSAEVAARAPSQNGANVKVNAQGLHVASSDGRHNLSFTPFIQFAHHQMLNHSPDGMRSGTRIEHFRPILVGQYNQILDYIFILQITADNVSLLYGFVNLHPHEKLQIRAGLQNPIFAIEMRQFQQAMLFINRSMDSSIGVICDLGLALDFRPIDKLQLELGVYNGTDDNHVFSGIQEKSVSGEIGARYYALGRDAPTQAQPGFLTLGAAAVLRRSHATAESPHLTPQVSPGQHAYMNYQDDVFADGLTLATTAFLHGGYQGFYVEGKFTTSDQQVQHDGGRGRIVKHAWFASAAYTIGGTTGWTGTTVRRGVFDGGLGALQFKIRGHGLIARSRGGDLFESGSDAAHTLGARGLSTGVSWFIADGLRIQADYNYTRFHADQRTLSHQQEHLLSVGLTAGY